jgi:23S rRNA (guanosine2251-2'-O)-methyltransferase
VSAVNQNHTKFTLYLTEKALLSIISNIMMKLHHYSEDKFRAFGGDKQCKALLELLSALEMNITEADYREVMIQEILTCIAWLKPSLQNEFGILYQLSDTRSPHDVLKLIVPLLNLHKSNHTDNGLGIMRFDGLNSSGQDTKSPFPLTVVLDNLRSAHNVGSIFRTAECVGANQLLLCGITPQPPHPKLIKTAMHTVERLNWQCLDQTEEAINRLKNMHIPVIALETTAHAAPLFDYQVTQPVGLILGNEALGIEEKILNQADIVLSIPVLGWKNSLNVSNAFAIAAYWLSGLNTEHNLSRK